MSTPKGGSQVEIIKVLGVGDSAKVMRVLGVDKVVREPRPARVADSLPTSEPAAASTPPPAA